MWYPSDLTHLAFRKGNNLVIRALGNTVTIKPGQRLTKHDFYLSLSDVLLDLVDKDPHSPNAKLPAQLGCSLGHDFLNLATIAGQLLWLVDVAPVRTGTPDSLSISMLAESYLMQLRAVCDVIAVIIHSFCIDDKKKGQVPDESFNDLVDWIEKNPSRVPESIKFVAEHKEWFAGLRSIRDKLVHHRFDINIFTNNLFPSFSVMSTGDIHLHLLRKPGEFMEPGLTLTPLMPFLKRATQGALELADKIAEVIATNKNHTPSRTHVLNGVYVPALYHLFSYEQPSKDATKDEEHRRKIKARHLWVAGDYLNAVKLGHPDGFWLPFAVHVEGLFGIPPEHIGEPQHPRYRDGEALLDWHFHFEKQGRRYVVLLRDGLYYSQKGLEGSRKDFEDFRERFPEASVVVVSDVARAPREIPAKEIFDGLILDTDPIQAAERAYAALVGSTPTESVLPSK
jgi:hypothetical protein